MAEITADVAAKVLDLPMGEGNSADAATVREYLSRLLLAVWREGEWFNSKRPFGYSGWEAELYHALARAGMVDGVAENGELWSMPAEAERKARLLIDTAIRYMCGVQEGIGADETLDDLDEDDDNSPEDDG